MARRCQYPQLNFTASQGLLVLDMDVHMRGGRPAVHRHFGAGEFFQLKHRSAMVGMRVRVYHELERTAVIRQHSQIAVGLLPDRINQQRFAGLFTGQQIGFAFALVQFVEKHVAFYGDKRLLHYRAWRGSSFKPY